MTFLTKMFSEIDALFVTEEKKLENILSVFTKTRDKLLQHVKDIEAKIETHAIIVEAALNESDRLTQVKDETKVVLKKFENFLK